MKKFILFSLIYYTTNAYNLLEHYVPTTITKEFYMCPSINDLLRETTIDVIKDINKYNILFISLKDETSETISDNNKNEICNTKIETYQSYGYTNLFGTNETDIYISNDLLYKPNTLYNVVYHEFIHALGLNHTIEQDGYMKYVVQTTIYGITEDNRKLYPSLDDIKGLRYIKRNLLC
tara:strand:- start:4082 stop:4615 length:534 start_codon:yes stop_codon:yes gene_type:complete